MPKGLLQQTSVHVSRPIDFTVMQRLDFFFLRLDPSYKCRKLWGRKHVQGDPG